MGLEAGAGLGRSRARMYWMARLHGAQRCTRPGWTAALIAASPDAYSKQRTASGGASYLTLPAFSRPIFLPVWAVSRLLAAVLR